MEPFALKNALSRVQETCPLVHCITNYVTVNDCANALLGVGASPIMSDEPLETVNERLEAAKAAAYALGVNQGIDPFMTLSFMALPVIPTLRITTQGVFDVGSQSYV